MCVHLRNRAKPTVLSYKFSQTSDSVNIVQCHVVTELRRALLEA